MKLVASSTMTSVPASKPGVQERILLHLRDYVDHADKVEVPFALSQMGIANAVSIARSNVPRAISGLRDQGYLIERQAHVTGVSRKRKAYFLTDDGAKLADDIWSKVGMQMVRVIGHDGRSSTMELQKALESTELPLRHVDVIRYLDDSGTIDFSSLSSDLIERDLSKHIEKQLVTSLGDLPRTRKFYGREKELENMVSLLEHQSGSILVPGIAGIVLTVGMAVDANVLIFSRIKEELRAGLGPQEAIKEGFSRAFTTIFDANITTLIAALVLYAIGTGPIKGFAITLSIGIVTSMFTAIMGTRAVVNLIYGNKNIRELKV